MQDAESHLAALKKQRFAALQQEVGALARAPNLHTLSLLGLGCTWARGGPMRSNALRNAHLLQRVTPYARAPPNVQPRAALPRTEPRVESRTEPTAAPRMPTPSMPATAPRLPAPSMPAWTRSAEDARGMLSLSSLGSCADPLATPELLGVGLPKAHCLLSGSVIPPADLSGPTEHDQAPPLTPLPPLPSSPSHAHFVAFKSPSASPRLASPWETTALPTATNAPGVLARESSCSSTSTHGTSLLHKVNEEAGCSSPCPSALSRRAPLTCMEMLQHVAHAGAHQ